MQMSVVQSCAVHWLLLLNTGCASIGPLSCACYFFYIEYTALVQEQLAKLFVLEKKLADTVLTGLFVVFSGNHLASFMKGTHTNERNVEVSIKSVVLF